jgi:hypothetical protein
VNSTGGSDNKTRSKPRCKRGRTGHVSKAPNIARAHHETGASAPLPLLPHHSSGPAPRSRRSRAERASAPFAAEYWEGKRGACVGAFQQIIAQKERKEVLRDIITILKSTRNPQVTGTLIAPCTYPAQAHPLQASGTYANRTTRDPRRRGKADLPWSKPICRGQN